MGISNEGQKAEERYRAATGCKKPTKVRSGDAEVDGHCVEIKSATETVNQIRAVQYIPLIVLGKNTDAWYVVPAHIVVMFAGKKRRGQHTENPFECMNLNIKQLYGYEVVENNLKEATLNAIQEASQYQEIKDAMNVVLEKSKALSVNSVMEVAKILQSNNLIW